MTVGAPRPEEIVSDRVRQILIGLGYSEIMSLPLTTEEHQFERLRLPTPDRYPQVTNPKLKAYNVVRGHLLGGLMEALRENRRRPMPQRLFEIDNVVELDDAAETGAAEYRKLALAEIGRESGYATARSVVDALARELGWQAEYKAIEHPTFVPGRAAEILGRRPADRRLGRSAPRSAHELRPDVSRWHWPSHFSGLLTRLADCTP